MAVVFDELGGSPVYNIDRKNSGGTRMFKIAFGDGDAFIAELFPLPSSGYAGVASVNGKGWLVALKARFEAFDPQRPTGLGEVPPTYPGGWKVTVEYGIPEDDKGMQSGGGREPRDKSGPGGEDGSTGGKDAEFVSHTVSIGAEFQTLPSAGLYWDKDNPFVTIQQDVHAGFLIPIIEHQITLHQVAEPPWAAIRGNVGTVNAAAIGGGDPETVLFLGCEARQDITSQGAKAWVMEYKFSEKPTGWNKFFNPDSGDFEILRKKDGSKIYELGVHADVFPG